jgi:hypothetical protein
MTPSTRDQASRVLALIQSTQAEPIVVDLEDDAIRLYVDNGRFEVDFDASEGYGDHGTRFIGPDDEYPYRSVEEAAGDLLTAAHDGELTADAVSQIGETAEAIGEFIDETMSLLGAVAYSAAGDAVRSLTARTPEVVCEVDETTGEWVLSCPHCGGHNLYASMACFDNRYIEGGPVDEEAPTVPTIRFWMTQYTDPYDDGDINCGGCGAALDYPSDYDPHYS